MDLVASTAISITLVNIPVGAPQRIITQQPSSGYGTVSWASPTLRWSGGTTGQATASASTCDVFCFYSPWAGTTFAGTAMPAC